MKIFVFIFSILVLFTFEHADQLNISKAAIKLEKDSRFGKNNEWSTSFYDEDPDIAIAPEGSIFVSIGKQHTVLKFNSNGDFMKKIGQKGIGPGDLYFPGSLAVLDGKFLIIGEFSGNKRISIFDLNGKFVKIIRTQYPVFRIVALKKNKISYLTSTFSPDNQSLKKVKKIVVILDTDSGKEKVVDSLEQLDKGYIGNRNGIMYKIGGISGFCGDLVIAATGDGNLLIGKSNTPDIKIYSENGRLIHSFRLSLTPQSVSSDYIQRYKANKIKNMNQSDNKMSRMFAKRIASFSFKSAFCDNLPYYRTILTDSEGNFLVFKWTDSIGETESIKEFQIYSPTGIFIRDSRLDPGDFRFKIDNYSQPIVFSGGSIFGVFLVDDLETDDTCLRIIKSNLK